ncbi:MAG: response regulator transcription factor [Acidaminococcus sp.]|nr:response regulator transcription factor [Acidaminococcus sp.]MDD7398209.1 response regulator transcription factor [Bacillota bacterium]MDY4559637.1 response regulator transcription factor [Eubacteriales bacterium]MDY5345054.1 response regulator transcription factor [Eubacteriales bacterium]
MRVLLIEDSPSLSDALVAVLKKEKYEVENVYDGKSGYEYALSGIFDVILLDVMLPQMNGFEVLKKLRQNEISTPVIMLTALTDEANKVQGLDYGADDYIAKPFSIPELLARIRALTRRKSDAYLGVLDHNGVKLDVNTYELSYETKSVKLSLKEFEIMKYLYERDGKIADKENLIAKVWGFDSEFESNTVEVFISFLRKKLNFLNAPFTISAIRGVGYQLEDKKSE